MREGASSGFQAGRVEAMGLTHDHSFFSFPIASYKKPFLYCYWVWGQVKSFGSISPGRIWAIPSQNKGAEE
jgi:hypothetical protein